MSTVFPEGSMIAMAFCSLCGKERKVMIELYEAETLEFDGDIRPIITRVDRFCEECYTNLILEGAFLK